MTTPNGNGTPQGTATSSQDVNKQGGGQQPNQAGASGGQDENKGQTVPLAALQEERTKRQELAEQVSQLTDTIKQLQTAGQPQQQYDVFGNPVGQSSPYQQQMNQQQQLAALWEQNPAAAAQYQFQMMQQAQDSVNQNLEGQYNQLRHKDPEFTRYEGQVRNYINSLSFQQRNNPQIVQGSYHYVRGMNIQQERDNWLKEVQEKLARGEQVQGFQPAGTGGTPPAGHQQQSQHGLTPDMQKAAAAMGLTEEEYAKFRR